MWQTNASIPFCINRSLSLKRNSRNMAGFGDKRRHHFFATLRARTIFVGFNSFSNTQTRDSFFVSGLYAYIQDSSSDTMLCTAFEDPAWNLSRVLTHQQLKRKLKNIKDTHYR
ncbi:unnamed protein product [Parnassius mnemosyne]|uniref:Uncharacterized protein n=1 Tax=Parnassius mnemosyne TaxID=213953 RepID=A0AAV1KRQ1_9NEOP